MFNVMRNLWWVLGVVMLFVVGCGVGDGPHLVLKLGNGEEVVFEVEVADTFEERARGLQFVKSLPRRHGMWFVFDGPRDLSFWMKDTEMHIDIIFVSPEGEVINIAHDVPTCREVDPDQNACPTYHSEQPSQYVLELEGGGAMKWGIEKGDQIVEFPVF